MRIMQPGRNPVRAPRTASMTMACSRPSFSGTGRDCLKEVREITLRSPGPCVRHDLVSALPYFVSVGPVDYIDFEKDSHYFKHNLGEDMLVMSKRKSFECEREVRLFFKDVKGFTRDLYEPCPDGNGVYVPVNVSRIVKDVYVDPAAPSWFTALVTDFAQKNGLPTTRAKQSSLMLAPDYT
jgi:hypothetical protein